MVSRQMVTSTQLAEFKVLPGNGVFVRKRFNDLEAGLVRLFMLFIIGEIAWKSKAGKTLAFIEAEWPRYWTYFDLLAYENVPGLHWIVVGGAAVNQFSALSSAAPAGDAAVFRVSGNDVVE